MMKRAMLIVLLFSLIGCGGGGGGIFTTVANENLAPAANKEFALASDFPAGLVIPSIAGMQTTAFIISVDSPVGVLAIDLDSMLISSEFAGCVLPAGTGYPTGALEIISRTRAFVLTSSHLIDCNPTTGDIRATLDLQQEVTLAQATPLSRPFDIDGDGTEETTVTTLTPSFPSGLAVLGESVFVSFSNYLQAVVDPAAAPGLVRIFHLTGEVPFLQPIVSPPLVTTAFNPTGLRVLPDGRLLVINSGINTITADGTVPLTAAGIDLINLHSGEQTWVDLGPVALSFTPPTISSDGRLAFLPSASYGEVYVVDLIAARAVRDRNDPILVTSSVAGSDFLPQAAIDPNTNHLYVASFSQSAIYPEAIDLSSGADIENAPPDPYVLGFPAGVTPENPSGANTGIGALAFRPGKPGIDFTGGNLFALTSFPGKLVSITTVEPILSLNSSVSASDVNKMIFGNGR